MRRSSCSIIERKLMQRKRTSFRGPNESALPKVLALLVFSLPLHPAFSDDKISYQDQILPLIEANCSKCHNADKKKADLDLTSYQGALKGSASGAVLNS